MVTETAVEDSDVWDSLLLLLVALTAKAFDRATRKPSVGNTSWPLTVLMLAGEVKLSWLSSVRT